ncbi:hypothetical protein C0J52_16276 [Blattella germanica]|nr:hypothetical protein C0J52_16276 [Blattella germanica]
MDTKRELLIALIAVLQIQCALLDSLPVVTIQQGLLQGTYMTSAKGRKFAAFQGVPYAHPPVGKHRFKLPTGKPEDALLDVIIFIHGGAFMYGSGDIYGPKILLDRDVVMVTFNYRLGPLGFLSTEDEVVPGNMGLKDQNAALQWIQENIAAFGGNPKSVTLTGNSAGGASVHFHYLSPLSQGLFHRGYSQSGTALCPWTQMEGALAKTKKLAAALGCTTETTKAMVHCLRKRPAYKIVQQVKYFKEWLLSPFSPFGAVVEKAGPKPFLDKHPNDIILEGRAQNLPWMVSVDKDEGLYPIADYMANKDVLQELEERFNSIVPHQLDFNYTVAPDKKDEVAQKIRNFYLKDKPIRVSHADDTGYTIDCGFINTDEPEDKRMREVMLDIWQSFASTGNPNPKGRKFKWEPIKPASKNINYLHIENVDKIKMESSEDLGNRKFWDALPIEENQYNDPVPPKPWIGTWNASEPGSKCLQSEEIPSYKNEEFRSISGDEDCLFINIYTPKLPAGKPDDALLDVIFFIHGGAFMYGTSEIYGPRILMDRDVILVTANYRLGPLGFLSTEDEEVPGNMGLKDQIAALQWTKENIAAFGGNPNSVTLAGNSAGGASVHFHYLSPLSQGALAKTKKLAAALGCTTESSKAMVKCLRKRPAYKIVQQVKYFKEWLLSPFSPFGAVVEKAGPKPFLDKHPNDIILEGGAQNLPWMVSVNKEEGIYPTADYLANKDVLQELNDRFNSIVPHQLDFNYTVAPDKKDEVADKIRNFYFKDKPISTETTSNIIQVALLHQNRVSHSDNAGYTIDSDFINTAETAEDRNMREVLLDIWESFASTGNPNPKGRKFTWEPIKPASKAIDYLHIESATKIQMESSEDLGNRKFWDALPIEENQYNVDDLGQVKHNEL